MDQNLNIESMFGNLYIESDNQSIDITNDLINDYLIDDKNNWIEEETVDDQHLYEDWSRCETLFATNHIHISALNEYCFIHLLSYLSFEDLLNMRSVCTQFKVKVEEYLRTKRKLKLINSFANQNINIETSEDT